MCGWSFSANVLQDEFAGALARLVRGAVVVDVAHHPALGGMGEEVLHLGIGGRRRIRTYTVTKYDFIGSASGAVNHYLEGTEYPSLGLHSWKTVSGQRGEAVWYGNDLALVNDEPESSGGAS